MCNILALAAIALCTACVENDSENCDARLDAAVSEFCQERSGHPLDMSED